MSRSLTAAIGLAGALAACAKLEPDVPRSCAATLPQAPPPGGGMTTEMLGACADDTGLHVAFVARDRGRAIADLVLREVRLTLARLAPRADGRTDWQSLVNRTEMPGQGAWPGKESAVQATADSGGVLKPAAGGVYIYTFGADPRAVTAPREVPWEPERLHRVSLELRGVDRTLPAANPTFDFRPDGEAAETGTRTVVLTSSCNACHGTLAAHGGARTEVGACVTCHNPGSSDAQSGETIAFASLVHRIHRGKDLPSVRTGKRFVIWGNMNRAWDFSGVGFPQDVRNCRKCHDERDPATPEAARWQAAPGVLACGSCHDDVAFSDPVPAGKKAHPRGARAADDCARCHTPADVDARHRLPFVTPANPAVPAGSPVFAYEILSVENARGGERPVVTFRIKMNGAALDVRSLPPQLAYGPRLALAWNTAAGTLAADDVDNQASGQAVGQPMSFALDARLAATLAANPDGSFTTPAGALGTLPAAARNVAVMLEGTFTFKNALGQDVRGLAGDTVVARATGVPARRTAVTTQKCNACHERLSAHGGNRAGNVGACVLCHNPSATDYRRRPASLDMDMDGLLDDPDARGVDGLRERSIAFGEMIHTIHAGEHLSAPRAVYYGVGRAPFDFKEVRFPRRLADCEACHAPKSFELPLPGGVAAVTHLSAQAPFVDRSGASALDNRDDVKVSPTGAACTACHDTPAARAHALTSAVFHTLRLAGTEADSCATCHGPGRPYDVATVHAPPVR